ncbi:hypothetical protein ABW19_dt0209662 [Dactylella cylindrospora]|nr:hypothetical protein ABW19_dt0209662 [Dactylella cylindrospora]
MSKDNKFSAEEVTRGRLKAELLCDCSKCLGENNIVDKDTYDEHHKADREELEEEETFDKGPYTRESMLADFASFWKEEEALGFPGSYSEPELRRRPIPNQAFSDESDYDESDDEKPSASKKTELSDPAPSTTQPEIEHKDGVKKGKTSAASPGAGSGGIRSDTTE